MSLTSGNPAFASNVFSRYGMAGAQSAVMTVSGTVAKSALLLAILTGTASWTWSMAANGTMNPALVFGSMIAGFIVAMITCFKPTVAPVTAPIYAALEGVFLGAISNFIDQQYKGTGIAMQAVGATFGTLAMMLLLYGTRVIRVTERLKMGIVAATGAICLLYFVSFIVSMFGVSVPFINGASPIGIGFSLFVVGLAAFNLLLDFDFIEQGVRSGAPKNLEWYGAFGLMVTLIWLYLEILRLLSKFQRGSSN